MKQALALLTLLAFLSGCEGPTTGRDYNTEEIMKVSQFLAVSEDRLQSYLDGNITIEELGVSADRLRQAVEYVKGK